MSHFAEIDQDGKVLRVIVADQAFIDSGKVGDPANWKETSKERLMRTHYASEGFTYDAVRDSFIPQKPDASFVLDEEKLVWDAPTRPPKDGKSYEWDKATSDYKVVTDVLKK